MKISAGVVGVGGLLVAGIAAALMSKKASAAGGNPQYLANTEVPPVIDESAAGGVVSNSSFLGGFVQDSLVGVGLSEPRGIRNNNPLNIIHNSANKWVGQTGVDDKGFCIFDTPLNGARAAAKILNSYRNQGYTTIRKIITRWTSGDLPSVQANYVNYVAGRLGISADAVLNANNWAALLLAMAYFENGKEAFTFDLYVAGVKAAGV